MRNGFWLPMLALAAVASIGRADDLSGDLGLSGRTNSAARNVRARQIGGGASGGATGGVSGAVSGGAARVGGVRSRADLRTRAGAGAGVNTRGVGVGFGANASVDSNARLDARSDNGNARPSTEPGSADRQRQGATAQAGLVLRHRLAEIDHMRDLALEYGDEALLRRADEFEQRVRVEHRQRLEAMAQQNGNSADIDSNVDSANRFEVDANGRPVQRGASRVQGFAEAQGRQAYDARPEVPRRDVFGQVQGDVQYDQRFQQSGRTIENGAQGAARFQNEFQPPQYRPQNPPQYRPQFSGDAASEFDSRVNAVPQRGNVGRGNLDGQYESRFDTQLRQGGPNYVNEAALQQRSTGSGDIQFQPNRRYEANGNGRAEGQFYYGPPRDSGQGQPAPTRTNESQPAAQPRTAEKDRGTR